MTQRRPRSSAFSLIEVVLVVSILGVMSAIVLPRISGVIANGRVRAAAARLEADVLNAQAQARARSRGVTLVFTSTGYRVTGISGLNRAGDAYDVRLDQDPYGVRLASIDMGGDATLGFDMYGTPDSAGSVQIVGASLRVLATIDASTGKVALR